MGYVLFLIIGLLLFFGGLFLSRAILNSAEEYANDAPTESGREVRGRTSGNALFHAWLLVILGAGLILFTLYRFVMDILV